MENWRLRLHVWCMKLSAWWLQFRLRRGKRRINWHDMIPDLNLPKNYRPPKTVYSDEFQQWFCSGYRRCDKHAYPVVWHIWQRLDCPRCSQENSMPPAGKDLR